MLGIIRTRVGYTGGTKKNPHYHGMGDHSESVEVDFNPHVTTYRDLLMAFWNGHNPIHKPWSRQYLSAVFYHDDTQKQLALETMAEAEQRRGAKLVTMVQPAETFYLAEDYHQKYALRCNRDLAQEFLAIYPDLQQFVDSTAVSRANGFVSGYGAFTLLEDEIDQYGLSQEGRQKLLDIARQHK